MSNSLPNTTTTDEEDRGARTAILPVGSFEQHGRHLPLATDTLIACAISRELSTAYPTLLLPPVTISCSHEHSAWSGTVSISSATLHLLVADVYDSISRSGLTSLVIVNAHGGNYVLSNITQEGSAQGKNIALYPNREHWREAREAAKLETSSHEDMHAGELETSILLHTDPDVVRDGYMTTDWIANDRRHLLTTGMQNYTTNGVIGRPSLATAEKGKAVLDSLTQGFAGVLNLFPETRT